MSYEKKIVALAKQYDGEGAGKIGFIKSVSLDYNCKISFENDRFSNTFNEEKRKETNSKFYQATVRYSKTLRGFDEIKIQTNPSRLEDCFLQLQEYLKLELMKVEININIKKGLISEDDCDEDSIEALEDKLNKALDVEDYKLAARIKKEIEFNKYGL